MFRGSRCAHVSRLPGVISRPDKSLRFTTLQAGTENKTLYRRSLNKSYLSVCCWMEKMKSTHKRGFIYRGDAREQTLNHNRISSSCYTNNGILRRVKIKIPELWTESNLLNVSCRPASSECTEPLWITTRLLWRRRTSAARLTLSLQRYLRYVITPRAAGKRQAQRLMLCSCPPGQVMTGQFSAVLRV